MASQVRRDEYVHDGLAQEDVRLGAAEVGDPQRGPHNEAVSPSRRREIAKRVVAERGVSIRLACLISSVSETCYRFEAKKNAENEQITGWLLRLTDNNRNWGFGRLSGPA